MQLRDLMPKLSESEIKDLADAAGTKPVYLRHLAGGHRRPSLGLMVRLCKAHPKLKLKDLAAEFAP